ncbi:envelope glycoprotein [Limosa lapponica baueri]|uniref:Envelope glycoprotein n=1 Tax=Limosa lapponica baueri TaxID=1758121 RepID=A0A2I0T3Z4_LIMLA|nr:envelope glycoprotein [Limosa lapponica baueri]
MSTGYAPYYEAVDELNETTWKNGSNPPECPWNNNFTQGLTIQHVTGKGRCIGTVPTQYKSLCGSIISKEEIIHRKNMSLNWIIPTGGAKWVCSDIRMTPCISMEVFNISEFCIQVVIVPRLIYHPVKEVVYYFEEDSLIRQKREPITAITLATLLIAGGVGAGTGITSLVKNNEMSNLQRAVDEDLDRIEQSIDKLATSIKSLSEVVLQNRRGLDLLFLKEGGLCVAIQEECCSFVDHTGVVKDSMRELRKRLEQQKKERETGKSWYEGWFNTSPWLTTLLSALAGPLITIILGLIFGPYIIKSLLQLMKNRFDTTKLLILTQRNKE